ncbi:YciI family protein [Sphaerisporangium perillae]|uniref:YciI family protein n=1 Tax=Sphaerisporangium perillae TaxID=2935860 RepID=UPI0020101312|nr:YciI family protein [Sphaerisporangium perillae]
MRYMLLLKTAENSGMPPQELMEAIARFGEETAKAGVLLDTGGLAPTVMGTRIRLSSGKLTVTDGPFTESKEMIASYAVLEVSSKEEAVAVATRFMELHKEHWAGWEGESEVRQVFGADSAPAFGE